MAELAVGKDRDRLKGGAPAFESQIKGEGELRSIKFSVKKSAMALPIIAKG
jgi:hypothetical protein